MIPQNIFILFPACLCLYALSAIKCSADNANPYEADDYFYDCDAYMQFSVFALSPACFEESDDCANQCRNAAKKKS